MLQVVSSSISFGSCACMNSPQNQEKSLKVNYWTKGKRKIAILILNECQQIRATQKTEPIQDLSS